MKTPRKIVMPPESDPTCFCIECESDDIQYDGSYFGYTVAGWVHEYICTCGASWGVVDKNIDKYAEYIAKTYGN